MFTSVKRCRGAWQADATVGVEFACVDARYISMQAGWETLVARCSLNGSDHLTNRGCQGHCKAALLRGAAKGQRTHPAAGGCGEAVGEGDGAYTGGWVGQAAGIVAAAVALWQEGPHMEGVSVWCQGQRLAEGLAGSSVSAACSSEGKAAAALPNQRAPHVLWGRRGEGDGCTLWASAPTVAGRCAEGDGCLVREGVGKVEAQLRVEEGGRGTAVWTYSSQKLGANGGETAGLVGKHAPQHAPFWHPMSMGSRRLFNASAISNRSGLPGPQ